MVWYADGSIQVEANGQVATGTGTAFLKNVRIGDGLTIAGSASMHEVTNIASDTQLTFSPPFTGAAGAGKQYRIAPIQGYVKEAADRLREVLREVGPLIMSEALQALADAETDQDRRAAVGLGKVDNTADIDKPLSKAMADALADPGQKNPDLVGQAEAEAGTGTGIRSWPVVRVWQSIAAWAASNLGTAAKKNVTSSSIDKTSDRVLKTGDGGWMGDVPVSAVTNIDDRTMRGWRYITGPDIPGTRPGSITYGHIFTGGNTNDAVFQELWDITGGAGTRARYYRQTFADLAWGPWRQILSDASIERGSNANGDYTKYPDGTLVCTGRLRMPSQSISTDSGKTVNFAAAFASAAYDIQITPLTAVGTGSQAAIGALLQNGIYMSLSSASVFVASYSYRAALDNPVDLTYIATGRWK